MIYQYKCHSCEYIFTKNLPMDKSKTPLSEPCPRCENLNNVYRDYSSVNLSYDMMDVHTRAKNVAGSDWKEVLKKIDKTAGRNSRVTY
jgi:rubredoxin